ncbi:MAG: twin arginine-targeting protein translocase TatB [Candidatus Schekmanbacteria bacterium RIFCSPHIGHO2_02_FULL_38_11]|uniref:Twin arginine-targeting protein translocase TatB n=1 Tax=Candidatus Schekmanbacteria bacterium RIFCSPLOWO2_12_FULL_38_15 TaxID=1817883 RepID=A0A1F7SDT9_9BACT|nr:MAG: twin arginine-targeting protein translocase TatB [Candidatus Schekmanbacteria bacterium GWA2_38_9]OGL51677.1 MAG: twin arginine-targeting protein translocase TatB [Candidatus Schekmanbacteria bacterium RIFCSPHIGHO2_02_FULL_38_11]OGL51942.1 MAG: twin arginine-targeting protein translocase TatB [Candidatus Schekmanbacteria bacterium RIFCSPLOWO2_12_FULL_38_15]
MFGIGFQEMLVIVVLALVLIGPKRLPEVAKAIGKTLAEFKRAVEDVKETVNEEMFKEEKKLLKDEYEDMKSSVNIDLEEKVGNGEKKS